jgi:hypothetical protein
MSDPRARLGKEMLFHRFHSPYHYYRSSLFKTEGRADSLEVSREAAM